MFANFGEFWRILVTPSNSDISRTFLYPSLILCHQNAINLPIFWRVPHFGDGLLARPCSALCYVLPIDSTFPAQCSSNTKFAKTNRNFYRIFIRTCIRVFSWSAIIFITFQMCCLVYKWRVHNMPVYCDVQCRYAVGLSTCIHTVHEEFIFKTR